MAAPGHAAANPTRNRPESGDSGPFGRGAAAEIVHSGSVKASQKQTGIPKALPTSWASRPGSRTRHDPAPQ